MCLQRIVGLKQWSAFLFPTGSSGTVTTEQFHLEGGVCLRPSSDDSLPYCGGCCCEFCHVQPEKFPGRPSLWRPCSILLMVWLPLSGKPDPSKEDPGCALRFHAESLVENTWMDKLAAGGAGRGRGENLQALSLAELRSSGFCLLKKLSCFSKRLLHKHAFPNCV